MPSSSSTARSTPYAPPTPLEDLHILDYLELAGSQYKAARELEMHQTTVCRSLQHLRLAYREQLWLLLPQRAAGSRAARLCLRRLRLQVTRLKTMQDRHGIQV